MDNKQIGRIGEEIAQNYLIVNGYIIIDKNFSCKIGEIDIIAKEGEYIVFVEVKTRRSKKYGIPCEAVDYWKKNKIIKVANYYINNKKLYESNVQYRFDVIEIYLDNKENIEKINLIKNAFEG
jgi:putative endonuclease